MLYLPFAYSRRKKEVGQGFISFADRFISDEMAASRDAIRKMITIQIENGLYKLYFYERFRTRMLLLAVINNVDDECTARVFEDD